MSSPGTLQELLTFLLVFSCRYSMQSKYVAVHCSHPMLLSWVALGCDQLHLRGGWGGGELSMHHTICEDHFSLEYSWPLGLQVLPGEVLREVTHHFALAPGTGRGRETKLMKPHSPPSAPPTSVEIYSNCYSNKDQYSLPQRKEIQD